MSLNLSTAVSERMTPFSASKPALTFYLSDFALSLVYDSLSVSWNELAAQIGHHGPEYVLAFLKTAVRSLKPARLAARKWTSWRHKASEGLFLDILRSTAHHVDRLSIIQPSFLVQHGLPKYLREDSEFRLLFALREGLWSLDREPEPEAKLGHQTNLQTDLKSLLLQRLERYIDPTDFLSYEPVSIGPFLSRPEKGKKPEKQTHKHPQKLLFLAVHMQRLVITLLDPQGGVGGRASLEGLDIRLRARTRLLQSELGNKSYESETHLNGSLVERTNLSFILTTADFVFTPALMDFAQHVVRVQRRYASSFSRVTALAQPTEKPTVPLPNAIDFQMTLGRASLRAIAATLTIEIGMSRVQLATSWMVWTGGKSVGNLSLLFSDVYIHARSLQSPRAEESDEASILASLVLFGGKVNTALQTSRDGAWTIRAATNFAGLSFTVPRSALKLYRFATDWQESFLPALEATAQELMAEIRTASSNPSPKPTQATMEIHLVLRLSSLRVALQVLPGTWLSWDINESLVYTDSAGVGTHKPTREFAARCTSQIVTVRATERSSMGPSPETRLKLALPSISVKGQFGADGLTAIVLVDFITITVKPSHWDTFLAVQQKFGQDFNDLVGLIQETRAKRSHPRQVKELTPDSGFKYKAHFKMRGFRVGLRAATSAIYLECFNIQGNLDDEKDMKWRVAVTDLALSLVPGTRDSAAQIQEQAGFMRDYKTAFVIIDFKVSAKSAVSDGGRNNHIKLDVTKIHAVMQASSVSEFGDFADHLQVGHLHSKFGTWLT